MLKEKYEAFKQKSLDFIDKSERLSYILRVLRIRDNREAKRNFRTIYINNVKPPNTPQNIDEPLKYKKNEIVTSKYTLLTFIPKNLFEQFQRLANFFFLFNVIVLFIIPDPPTSPFVSMLPLLLVIIVTAIKQGYEDILRHRSDREINNSPVRILRDGKFKDTKWRNIKCGDIVEVKSDQSFPCDLVLLYAETDNHNCYITTANLDGETNLKVRSVPPNIPRMTKENLSDYRGIIQCDKPNVKLYEFNGKLLIDEQEYPLVNENILLRGSRLKIAPCIYGCAIYCGLDTKIMKNTLFKSNKFSCIEKKLNQYIFIFLILLGVISLVSFFGSLAYYNLYTTHWYLSGREPSYYTNPSLYRFVILIFYVNLYNRIVPLSMYVSIELQRFFGSRFIESDLEMYDPATDQPAKVNSSDINEDLGQVEYLFSDKTGTLTENQMVFKAFSINGTTFAEKDGEIFNSTTNQRVDLYKNKEISRLIEILSLCHTVLIDESENAKDRFSASSPDEFSFLKFCQKLSIEYQGEIRDPKTRKLIREVDFGKLGIKKYELLQLFEFDPTRKRMSVILKDLSTNQILLFCKGADVSVLKNCSKGDVKSCQSNLKLFSVNGLRTLVLSYSILSDDEYAKIEREIKEAYNDIVNREKRLAQAYDLIETNLTLAGATAVEDKLQENVAETLESLRRAGIKIWVLTGDKKETAINISYSCKHFSDNMIRLTITDLKAVPEIEAKLASFKEKIRKNEGESYALIIDGATLGYLFSGGKELQKEFCKVCLKCDAVLCCRMSPAQKAEVVKLVKQSASKPMTAAIGDGANDVSMIQEAHIGLGIFGKEGRNAARSADFAFTKFKFVKKILLVHGFYFYTRAATTVHYFFYKNLVNTICQFYYAFSNGFSVTSLFDPIIMSYYNVLFTAVPILFFGISEQKYSMKELQKNHFLYRTITRNKLLKMKEFLKWNFLALWHSLTTYLLSYFFFSNNAVFFFNGQVGGSYQLGILVAVLNIIVVHIKLLIEWRYMTFLVPLSFMLSALGAVVFMIIPSSLIIPSFLNTFTDNQNLYWLYNDILSKPSIWFLILMVVIACVIPDVIIKIAEGNSNQRMIRKLKQIETGLLEKKNAEQNGSHISLSIFRVIPDRKGYKRAMLNTKATRTSIPKYYTSLDDTKL